MSGTERTKKRETRLRKEVEGACVKTLQESFGDNLRSVIAYGSYAGGHFVPGTSDVNLLVVLEASNPGQVESFGRKGKSLIRRLNITPLILTKAEFLSSADVFPIEYADIQARHKVLMGEDLTASLALHTYNLRHQLEDRFRGAAISLRKLIVASRGSNRLLGRHLKTWVGPLNALFRGLLRLRSITEEPEVAVPNDAKAVLEMVKHTFPVDTGPLIELIVYRKVGSADARRLSHTVLSALEELISVVDRYRT
jgi:predicted nucleotidyltransferase